MSARVVEPDLGIPSALILATGGHSPRTRARSRTSNLTWSSARSGSKSAPPRRGRQRSTPPTSPAARPLSSACPIQGPACRRARVGVMHGSRHWGRERCRWAAAARSIL